MKRIIHLYSILVITLLLCVSGCGASTTPEAETYYTWNTRMERRPMSSKQPEVVVFVGPNGPGKSTFTALDNGGCQNSSVLSQ